MCVVVTYDCDSWIKRGASRPAVAGSVSPEWEIFFRKSMELSYGVPEGVNGTRKNLSPVAWTACSYLRRLRIELSSKLALPQAESS